MTSPSPVLSAVKVATLSLFHLCFVYRVAGDGDLPPIWEAVAGGRGSMEGMSTLNQALMQGLTSCCRVFRGRANLSPPPPASVREEH